MKTSKQKKILIEELEKNPIIEFAVKRAGVARATYYRWIARNKKFAEDARKALEKGVNLINDLAEATLITLIKDRNFPATRYWLAHRHPAYSEKPQPLKPPEHDNRKLTPEESALLEKAIELDYGKDWNKKPEKTRTIRINKTLAYNIAS